MCREERSGVRIYCVYLVNRDRFATPWKRGNWACACLCIIRPQPQGSSLSLSLIRKEKNPRHDDEYDKEFFNVFDKICMKVCPKINLFISSTI